MCYYCYYYYHHHHISVMQSGDLLIRSGLTYPEVSSKVYHDSLCQLGSIVSLTWVIIIILFVIFMQYIYSYVPETNHHSMLYSAAAVL